MLCARDHNRIREPENEILHRKTRAIDRDYLINYWGYWEGKRDDDYIYYMWIVVLMRMGRRSKIPLNKIKKSI